LVGQSGLTSAAAEERGQTDRLARDRVAYDRQDTITTDDDTEGEGSGEPKAVDGVGGKYERDSDSDSDYDTDDSDEYWEIRV